MMNSSQPVNVEIYRNHLEIQRIGNRAVHEAQEDNRRKGIPNVYSRNGKLYYELPDGELTRDDPLAV